MEAVYTYDAVKVYALAAHQIMQRNGDVCNGTDLVKTIIDMGSYPSDIQGINVSSICIDLEEADRYVLVRNVNKQLWVFELLISTPWVFVNVGKQYLGLIFLIPKRTASSLISSALGLCTKKFIRDF